MASPNGRVCFGCGVHGHKCLECNAYGGPTGCGRDKVVIHAHHIQPRAHGGEDLQENMVDLCPKCHKHIHALYNHQGIESAFKNDPDFFKKILNILPEYVGRTWPI